MGIFSKSRRTTILNATKGLSNMLFSKTMDLSEKKEITEYEQNVLAWIFLSAKGLVDSLLIQEGYPLTEVDDKELGLEGNALNAYYKSVILMLFLHEQRIKNKPEIKKIADTPLEKICETVDDLTGLEKGYVSKYISHLNNLQKNLDGNTLDVIYQQMYEATKDLMSDGRKAKELFDDPKAKLFLPLAINIHIIEQTKAIDNLLKISQDQ